MIVRVLLNGNEQCYCYLNVTDISEGILDKFIILEGGARNVYIAVNTIAQMEVIKKPVGEITQNFKSAIDLNKHPLGFRVKDS